MNIHVNLESIAPSKPGHLQEERTVPADEVEPEPADEEEKDSGSTTRSWVLFKLIIYFMCKQTPEYSIVAAKINSKKEQAEENWDEMGGDYSEIIKYNNNEEFEAGFIAGLKQAKKLVEEYEYED